MATLKTFMVAGVFVLGSAGTSMAQVTAAETAQIHQRQQIAQMEGALQLAVVHGADLMYAQFRNILPDRPRLGSQPRVSGFTLPNYGTVFTVDVPMVQLPLLWEVYVRDAAMQLQQMRRQWSGMSPGRERDQLLEAINRAERELGMDAAPATEERRNGPNGAPAIRAGSTSTFIEKDADDPTTVYSREVKEALIDAMLTNSQGLSIGPDEWLTIMAMARETNSSAPGASVETSRGIIRVKGSVLTAYRSGTITKEEARNQVEIREQ